MSRQNGMCKILSLDCSLPLGDMWHCDKSRWKGNKINKCSCAFTKAKWDPCEIIWTGNWSSGGFGFLKIWSLKLHRDWSYPNAVPGQTGDSFDLTKRSPKRGRGLEWLVGPWLEVLDPPLPPALPGISSPAVLEEEGRDHEIHWNLRWPVSGKL